MSSALSQRGEVEFILGLFSLAARQDANYVDIDGQIQYEAYRMKLAILLGVAKYTRPVPDLPACTSDVKLMAELIEHTNKFSEVLEISADTSSSVIKTQLAQFVTKYKGQAIDELFFYYSGHGDLYKEDFYYLFTDYSDSRRNQTSLTNEELDSMLRTLSPKLTVKVVDACHAGVTYVKDSDALTKQLQTSKGRFSDCYFMFSSQSSQASLQDDKLSDFTKAFVEACTTFTGQEIRYRDIVDHISDAFTTNTEQTPTFVIQAPCVEIFCSVSDTIRKLVLGKTEADNKTKLATPNNSTMVELIRSKAKEFMSKDEALEFLNGFCREISTDAFKKELKEMYKLNTEDSDNYDGIPNLGSIGKWVDENKEDFFARVVYTSEDYTTEEPDITSIRNRPFDTKTRTVIATRKILSGFESTAETPFKSIRISAAPTHEGLPHAIALVVFVMSKLECVFFYMFQTIKETDWGKLAPLKSDKWTYMRAKMKPDPHGANSAKKLFNLFEAYVLKTVQEKLGLATDPVASSPAKADDAKSEHNQQKVPSNATRKQ